MNPTASSTGRICNEGRSAAQERLSGLDFIARVPAQENVCREPEPSQAFSVFSTEIPRMGKNGDNERKCTKSNDFYLQFAVE